MRNILQRFNASMARFMYGRYGCDELSRTLLIVSMMLLILSNFRGLRFLYYIAFVIMVWSIYRCYSRKIDKRIRERRIYLMKRDNARYKVKIRKKMWTERKTHKYLKCSCCKMYFRVPKGVGKIVATCPKCSEKKTVKC